MRAPLLEDAVYTTGESGGHNPRHCCLHHSVSFGSSCSASFTLVGCAGLRVSLIYMIARQNDTSSQEFYSRTVAALEKKRASDQEVAQKLQDIKDAVRAQEPVVPTVPQKSIAASTENGKPIEGKVLTSAEEQDSTLLRMGKGADDAKSVAGRKTMLKSGETKDLHSGREAPMGEREKEKYPAGKKKLAQEEKAESQEDHEVELELNSILKKGPSTSKSTPCAIRGLGHSR